jgi:glutamate/tyrosine decarboxylase-like PLP-dependent enzyme
MPHRAALERAAALAIEYLEGVRERPVGRPADVAALRAALGGPLPEGPTDPAAVIDALARAADPGIVASQGPRFFGFVIGGALPAAVAADWLASAWDQNAGLSVAAPAAAVVEEVAARWLVELFGLPPGASVGFATGATMASFTALAAARHAVLRRTGWDVEEHGLSGAPALNVVVGEGVHATILAAVQLLGLGRGRVHRIVADEQGRMRPDALRALLADQGGPTIVCAQAGDVNTGAFDPLGDVCDAAAARGAWVHVDGAIGLWAAASPALRSQLAGCERADSWTTDGHKWLNVPYDSGLVFVRDPLAHRAAMSVAAPYLATSADERDPSLFVPETSRRARGFAVYAALRSLGRRGVADLVERCCALARRMAERLRAGGAEIVNDVVLNQVLVRFPAPAGADPDAFQREVIRRVQADGTCWLGGTHWNGRDAVRFSTTNWSTTADDIDRSAAAIVGAYRASLEATARAAAAK